MSDKKNSDSGSSLKSIGEIINNPIVKNILSKVLSSRNVLEKGPAPFLDIDPKDLEDRGPAPFLDIDPKDLIQPLSSKTKTKETYTIGNVPTTKEGFEMFTNKFQRLNEEGKKMFQMLLEKNPETDVEKILDAIMGRPEFLSNVKTLSDILDERAQSKADGGIMQLFGNM